MFDSNFFRCLFGNYKIPKRNISRINRPKKIKSIKVICPVCTNKFKIKKDLINANCNKCGFNFPIKYYKETQ